VIDLSELVLDRILKCVRNGVFPERAAAFAGVPLVTFRRWIERGERAGRGKYRQLFDAVREAEAACERDLTLELHRAAESDPGACLAFMERRFAERWGRRRRTTHAQADRADHPTGIIYLPPEEPDPTAIPKLVTVPAERARGRGRKTSKEA
jgi:hypothetical protein